MQCQVCKKMKTPLDFEYWSRPTASLSNTINHRTPNLLLTLRPSGSPGPVRALDQALRHLLP